MMKKYNLKEIGANIVYVKSVDAADLPQDMRDQVGDLETLYAVHGADGAQLAVMAHPDIAVKLAHDNNLMVVSLH